MDYMSDIIRVILRALLSLITLFLITKMIGKKQISELSLFDYVIGISIGNFAAEMTINLESHFLHGTIAVIVFGVMAYIINYLTMKSIILRRFFSGIPTVLIKDGVILEKSLKKCHYDINEFLEQARIAGYFNISDISYAIMESNGSISFLAKKDFLPVTKKDLNLKATKEGITRNVIIDGKVMVDNMTLKEKIQLECDLKVKNKTIKDVFLATIDQNGKIVIFFKNDLIIDSKLE